MIKELFESQRKSLDFFFEQIDALAVEKVLAALLECKGSVIFSGVGKSGHIAEKVAKTFLSTGTHALFLSPQDALHGDIAMVRENDLVILFSKSGATRELLALVPRLKAKTVAVTCQESELSRACNLSVILPLHKELCPFDLAPTTSTTEQLIFGDVLAIALMRKKQFQIATFAENHPSGLLGKKITAKVVDLMLKEQELPVCRESDLLIDVLHQISEKKCGCLLVVDEKKALQGIFTDGDLRRALQNSGSDALQRTLATLMSRAPRVIAPEELAHTAIQQMEGKNPVTVLPVTKNNVLVGLIRMHDILQKGIS